MAAFDPQVAPGRDDMPDWIRKAGQPISDLVPDKSGGIAMQTAATGIEGATDIAKTTFQQVIDKDVRDTVEPVRNDFTRELEIARAAQRGDTDTVQSLTQAGQPKQSVPTAVDAGVSKVDALQSALANGKINDTYYDLRLKTAVTDLRSKYPGYVDYIDQKVSQITGVNPANAYIQNLMQDINQRQVQKKTEVDKAIDDTTKSGYPNSDKMVQQLQRQGEAFMPQYRQWYSEQTMLDAQLKRRDAFRKDSNANKDELNSQRTSDWTNEVGGAVQSNLSSMVTISGLDKPQNILAMMQDSAANPDKYTEAQYKQLATQLMTQKSVLERQLTARLNQTARDSQGRTYSYASDVGADKATSIIKDQLTIYDTMAKALTDGNAGLAFYSANHAKAILDQTQDNLLTDKTVGGWAAKMSTFNQTMGPNWTNLVTSQSLRNNIDDKMRSYLDNNTLDARLGNGVTLKQHMDDAKKLQDDGRITGGMRSRYVGQLVNLVDDIKNPNAPDADKANILKYMFSPEGQGILQGIKTDYHDPVTNKDVPGKYAVFSRLTSDDIVKEVSRLAKSDPKVGQMYKNYLENEAGSQLFYKEFQNLNFQTGQEDLHFKYNDGATGGVPNIELIDKSGKPMNNIYGAISRAPSQIQEIQKSVNRVNEALAGMGRVEKGLGGDPSTYLLDFMQRAQVNLGKNWEGLPKKMMDAIAASRQPQRRLEDTFKEMGK